jgi:hypothetical protein
MNFDRKATVQALDSFPVNANLAEVDKFIREQKVPGELVVSYPGNAGRNSVIFKGKPRVLEAEVQESTKVIAER